MIAILRKDLRLSLDALVPWLAVVVAIVGFGMVSAHFRNVFSMLPSRAALLEEFASLLVLSIGAVTAWITAVVLHGDGRHRAGSLAAALPVSPAARDLTRFLSVLATSAVPIAVCMFAQQSRSYAGTLSTVVEPGRAWWLPIAMGVAGIGWAWMVGEWTRRVFEIVMLSVVASLLSVGMGLAGAWLYDSLVLSPLVDGLPGALEFRQMFWQDWMKAIPGLALLVGGGAALVLSFLRRTIGWRRAPLLSGLTVLAAFALPAAAGAFTGHQSVGGDSRTAQMRANAEQLRRVQSTTDADMVAFLAAWNAGSDEPLALGSDIAAMEPAEVFVNLERMARSASVERALAGLSRVDRADAALLTLRARYLTRGHRDQRTAAVELEAIRHHPTDRHLRSFAKGAVHASVAARGILEGKDLEALAQWLAQQADSSLDVAELVQMLSFYAAHVQGDAREHQAVQEAARALRQAWKITSDESLPPLPFDALTPTGAIVP
jgi:hypothetical protein